MHLSVSHVQLQTPTRIGILSHLAVLAPFYKGECLIWSSLCRIYSGSIVFSFPSCSLPKHSGLCVLAHSCLHVSFHYWAFALFFFSFASSPFSLVPQNDFHKDYKWYFYICPKISSHISTCLSLTIRSLKAEFFTTLSFSWASDSSCFKFRGRSALRLLLQVSLEGNNLWLFHSS